ncbi:hypothetical protein SH139x_002925 [Planctomycetaceae bacterium SH139]
MLRTVLLACTSWLLLAPLCFAAEPNRLLIVVPDKQTADTLAAAFPGVRSTILKQHEGEPQEAINRRALALRHATHFVFDDSRESLDTAMFRERLQMHGVTTINLRHYLPTADKIRRPANAEQSTLITKLLAINLEPSE